MTERDQNRLSWFKFPEGSKHKVGLAIVKDFYLFIIVHNNNNE